MHGCIEMNEVKLPAIKSIPKQKPVIVRSLARTVQTKEDTQKVTLSPKNPGRNNGLNSPRSRTIIGARKITVVREDDTESNITGRFTSETVSGDRCKIGATFTNENRSKPITLRFEIAASLVENDNNYPLNLSLASVCQCQLTAVAAINPIPNVTITPSVCKGKIGGTTVPSFKIAVKGKTKESVGEATTLAWNIANQAKANYLYDQYYHERSKDSLGPDYYRLFEDYAGMVSPIAQALLQTLLAEKNSDQPADSHVIIPSTQQEMPGVSSSSSYGNTQELLSSVVGAGITTRQIIARVLIFVQSIPYETAEGGYRRPLSVIAQFRGNCGSKSVLFLSILRNIFPQLGLCVFCIPQHVYVGVDSTGMELDPDDHLLVNPSLSNSIKYVGIEPVGPGRLPIGKLKGAANTLTSRKSNI